jgi:signal peptidase I
MLKSKLITISALVVFAALLIVKLVFIDFAIVPQDGMFPGISANSFVFFSKRPYGNVSDVVRGDVIMFDRTERNGKEYTYIWRVIGLPGDSIEVNRESVQVNGQSLQRERIREENGLVIFRELNSDASYEVAYSQDSKVEIPPPTSVTVPEGHVFVLGDNRYNAVDSRYFGPVPFSSITGRKL